MTVHCLEAAPNTPLQLPTLSHRFVYLAEFVVVELAKQARLRRDLPRPNVVPKDKEFAFFREVDRRMGWTGEADGKKFPGGAAETAHRIAAIKERVDRLRRQNRRSQSPTRSDRRSQELSDHMNKRLHVDVVEETADCWEADRDFFRTETARVQEETVRLLKQTTRGLEQHIDPIRPEASVAVREQNAMLQEEILAQWVAA